MCPSREPSVVRLEVAPIRHDSPGCRKWSSTSAARTSQVVEETLVEVEADPKDEAFDPYPEESIAEWRRRLGLEGHDEQ